MKKRIIAVVTVFCVLFSIIYTAFASASYIAYAGEEVEYSIGKLLPGSYEGYADVEIPNYTTIEQLTETGNYTWSDQALITFKDGIPAVGGASARLTYNPPAMDKNGNERPSGKGNNAYMIVYYSPTTSSTRPYVAPCNSVQIKHVTSLGGMQISTAASHGAAESWFNVTGVGTVEAGDIMAYKVLQKPQYTPPEENKGVKYAAWVANQSKGTGYNLQFEDKFTKWGSGNITPNNINVVTPSNATDPIAFYGAETYEEDEYNLREAISKVESNMLSANQSIDRIMGSVNLATDITVGVGTLVKVSWTSNNTNVITTQGMVTPSEQDEKVVLTATYALQEKIKTIEYELTVLKALPPEEQLENAAGKLTWDDMSHQKTNAVTDNLTLPGQKITDDGIGISISWQIVSGFSNVSIDGQTAVITRGNSNAEVTLRAVFTYANKSFTKDFSFTVLKMTTFIMYAQTDYWHQGDREILEEDNVIKIPQENTDTATVRIENEKGLRAYSDAKTKSNVATATIDFGAKVRNLGLWEQYKNFESKTIYEFSTIYEIPETGVSSETQIKLLNNEGKMITFLQYTGTSNTAATINVKQNNAWTNGTSVPAVNDFIINKLRAGYNSETKAFPAVSFKLVYDRVTTMYNLYLKLEQEDSSEYVLFYGGALPTETITAGSTVEKLEITTTINSPRHGAISLCNFKVYTTDDMIREYVLEKMSAERMLGGQSTDAVTGDINLNTTPHYGIKAAINMTSLYDGTLFDNDGKLVAVLKPEESYQVTLKITFTLIEPVFSNIHIEDVVFDFFVRGVSSDSLAYKKKVVVSGAIPNSGSAATNINDGITATSFITSGSEQSFNLLIDLAKDILFSRITIREGVTTDFNVGSWIFEGSKDRKSWDKLAEGKGIGQSKTFELSSPYTPYRYVRLTINDKKISDGKVELAELMLYFQPDQAHKDQNDFESIKSPPTTASDDFYLQGVGEIYGGIIEWKSGNPELLKIGSLGNDNLYKVTCRRPLKSTSVTLKATIGTFSQNFTVSLPGTSNTGGIISGGGGTGGGTIGGVISYSPPKTQKPNEDNQETKEPEDDDEDKGNDRFSDLDDAQWAKVYINVLADKNVISGDDKGLFHPNKSITRQEFIKMIVAALGIQKPEDIELPFDDVSAEDWSYGYIAAAYSIGLIKGDGASFGKETAILRQDMAVILSRVIDSLEKKMQSTQQNDDFKDVDNVDDYALESVRKIQRHGILSGDTTGKFNPKDTATKAHAAKVVYLLMESM